MGERERLKVLDAAQQFGVLVVELTKSFRRGAPSGLRSQLVAAAMAVSGLLAEGFGRKSVAEIIHYSHMANGSLEECQNYLRECVNLRLIDKKTFYRAWNLSVATSKMLIALIETYERKSG